jgi:VTT domain
VSLTEERLNKAEDFFDRRGAIVITFARFVEGLRQANGIIAGITGMHWLRFLIFNAIGAALWVGTWVSLGYLAGNHIGTIYHYITLYSYYALIALAVLIVGYIVWRLRRRRRRLALVVARQVSEAHESRTTGEAAGVMPDKHEADGAGSDKHEAAEAAPGTHQAEAVPDTNQAAGPAPGNQEVTRAPGKHEAVQAAPDDEAAGPAPTEHAADRHAADRHAPERRSAQGS